MIERLEMLRPAAPGTGSAMSAGQGDFMNVLRSTPASTGTTTEPAAANPVKVPEATADSALSGGASLEVEIELGNEGHVILTANPWRLVARGPLAQCLRMGLPFDSAQQSGDVGEGHAASMPRVPRGSVNPRSGPVPGLQISLNPGRPIHGQFPMHVQEGNDAPETIVRGQATWGMAASWLERLVRWLERPEGDAAIWVRDYRLDDATARRVVELIRTGAREQGLEVGRIVINARELWRAPTPKALEEH